MALLCVNIDHIATLRQARRDVQPDPVQAVLIVENAGSTGITVHLREDQRHIQERDVRLIRQIVKGHLNLEMAATELMIAKALEIGPDMVTLVPERREEVTTEGGLDVAGRAAAMAEAVERLQGAGITVSMFIDADPAQVEASAAAGAREVELHTGRYCQAHRATEGPAELAKLYAAGRRARELGLVLNAGHGLDYRNVQPVAAIPDMHELNIGHAIISRAVFDGLARAVSEMKALIDQVTPRPEAWRPEQT